MEAKGGEVVELVSVSRLCQPQGTAGLAAVSVPLTEGGPSDGDLSKRMSVN